MTERKKLKCKFNLPLINSKRIAPNPNKLTNVRGIHTYTHQKG